MNFSENYPFGEQGDGDQPNTLGDFSFFSSGDGSIENIFNAMISQFPRGAIVKKPLKEKKEQVYSFQDYKIRYFFSPTLKGFACYINLANIESDSKKISLKKLSLKYVSSTKLLISFYCQNIKIQDQLVLTTPITEKTVFEGYTVENTTLKITFLS